MQETIQEIGLIDRSQMDRQPTVEEFVEGLLDYTGYPTYKERTEVLQGDHRHVDYQAGMDPNLVHGVREMLKHQLRNIHF